LIGGVGKRLMIEAKLKDEDEGEKKKYMAVSIGRPRQWGLNSLARASQECTCL
jgi:hypothetical protein